MIIAEVDPVLAPRVVYTSLIRGENTQSKQRVFLLGGMNSKTKQLTDEVFEVNLSTKRTPKKSTTNLVEKSKMPLPKISFGCCVDSENQTIYTVGG